jgi:hypothetical protein
MFINMQKNVITVIKKIKDLNDDIGFSGTNDINRLIGGLWWFINGSKYNQESPMKHAIVTSHIERRINK